jgi:outer membrane protein
VRSIKLSPTGRCKQGMRRCGAMIPVLSVSLLLSLGGGKQVEAQSPPLPASSGVTPLPQDPPPTGPHRAIPNATGPLQQAEKPLAVSPALEAITRKAKDQTITLNDAIGIALATNRSLAFAGEALYRAQGRTAEVRSALYPTVSASPADVFLHDSLQPGFSVQATLPIDITGLLRAATDQARFQEIGTRLDINRTRNQTVYDVENAFYNALRAQTLVKVASENLQNSLDRLKDAQIRYSVQAVAYFDVVRAQTDVANAQKQVIQARNTVSNAIANLNLAMGIDVTTPLHITEAGAVEQPPGVAPPTAPPITPTTQVTPGAAAPESPTAVAPSVGGPAMQGLSAQRADDVIADALKLGPEFQKALQEALQTRPEILEADTQIAAAKKGILIARRSSLPSLSVSVGYFDVRNQTGTTRIDEPQALIGLNIPLEDAGLARARVQQARADVSNAVTNRRQQTDLVTLDVQQAYLNLVQARDQVAVASQALALARAGFQIARVRYNAGVGSRAGISPILEVSDAQAALTLAEQNQVNALYDYNGARAQLDRSVGRFAFVPNAPGYGTVPSAKVVGRPDH